MAESLQQLLVTNFGLSPSGYAGSRGDTGYVGSSGLGYTGSAGAGASVPTIASIGYVGNNTATDTAGGETITLTGTGFVTGCSVIINGSPVGAVTFISSTQVTFVAPALSAGTYILYVVNTNGSTAISVPGISYSGVPSFYVGAGSVGTVYEASSFNSNVAAVGDSAITYSVASGLLPTGATLNANGVITGTSVLTGNATTYTFGVNASDGQNQDVTRTYTITVNPDVVTWSTPTNSATISLGQGSSISTTLSATSAAGSAITYTANALPTGLSIVGSAVTGTPTVLGNTTSILTANATSTTRTSTITVTWNIAIIADAYFKYTTLMLSGNGTNLAQNNTFLDSSTNNFAITRNGNVTQGTFSPYYGVNWSNYFDGTGDSLSFVPGAFGSNNFTIEFWMYTTSSSSQTIFNNYRWYNGLSPGSILISFENSKINATLITGGGSDTNSAPQTGLSSATVLINKWTHVSVTRSGGTMYLGVDGVVVSSALTSNTGLNVESSQTTYVIGQWQYNGGGPAWGYTGYISNFRIVKNTALYTANYTVPTGPLTAISDTTILTCNSRTIVDNSASPLAITKAGNVYALRSGSGPFSPTSSYTAGAVGGSAYFDGNGDSLTIPTTTALSFGTGDFTIEVWVYKTTASNASIVDARVNPGTASPWGFFVDGSNFPYFYDGSTYTSSIAVTINSWNHIVVVRTSSTLKIFVNGVQGYSATVTTNLDRTAGAFIGVAANTSSPSAYWFGYMSDLRIVKGTAVYTSAFTPPTAPVTAVTNTSLLLSFTNAGIIDNAMQNNIETVGDAKISTAQSKFGSSSMYFDGTGDNLSMPLTVNLQFDTSDFTVECWNYMVARTNTYPAIFSNYNAYSAGSLSLFAGHGSGTTTAYQVAINGVSFPVITGGTISYNTWVHLAVVRYNGTISLYVNGTSVGTPYSTAVTLNGVGSLFYIGTSGDNIGSCNINGYIDDFRITKGIARYTANFTPPSAAFNTQ